MRDYILDSGVAIPLISVIIPQEEVKPMYSNGVLYVVINDKIVRYVFVEGEWKRVPSCQEQS